MNPNPSCLIADQSVLPVQVNSEGHPLIASINHGEHGYCGEVLIGGEVRTCDRHGTRRAIRDTDMVFTACGRFFPAKGLPP